MLNTENLNESLAAGRELSAVFSSSCPGDSFVWLGALRLWHMRSHYFRRGS